MINVVARAKALILSPRTEWPVIAAEPATVGGLFTGYAAILAGISVICGFIGSVVVGLDIGGTVVRMSVGFGITQAVLQFVLTLLGTWVLGKAIEMLSPTFGGASDPLAAMKVAVYGTTAFWLAGIFSAVPMLGFLGILGLYSLYLVYTGLPVLMRNPPEKTMILTVSVIACAVLINLVIGMIAAGILVRQLPAPVPAM